MSSQNRLHSQRDNCSECELLFNWLKGFFLTHNKTIDQNLFASCKGPMMPPIFWPLVYKVIIMWKEVLQKKLGASLVSYFKIGALYAPLSN
jgi:hypothetical protein